MYISCQKSWQLFDIGEKKEKELKSKGLEWIKQAYLYLLKKIIPLIVFCKTTKQLMDSRLCTVYQKPRFRVFEVYKV